MATSKLYKCVHCDEFVNPKLADDAPGKHSDAAGTQDDPHSPGDHKDCCDQCCYGQHKCRKE